MSDAKTPPPPRKDAVEAKFMPGSVRRWLGLCVPSVDEGEITLDATGRPGRVVAAERGYRRGGIPATRVDLRADRALVARTGRGVAMTAPAR